jgi:uncharacterized protein YggE
MDKTLTTRGTGSASGTPDALRLYVAVVVAAKSVSDALTGTASAVTAVGEVARRHTTEDRIASRGLQVQPQYDNNGRQIGYEARHSLTVFCPGLDKGGELVTALGALQDRVRIDGFEPVLSDPSPIAVEARADAWADARRKADELAALAGGAVGEAVAIVEGEDAGRPMGRYIAQSAMADSMPIEAGSQSVSATVTVTWALV